MGRPMKVHVTRVGEGESQVFPLEGSGFVNDRYPENGFLIRTDHPSSISVYLSDTEIEELRKMTVGEQLEL